MPSWRAVTLVDGSKPRRNTQNRLQETLNACSADRLSQKATDRIRIVHVPKTIDSNLDLYLGYCAARYAMAGGNAAGISISGCRSA